MKTIKPVKPTPQPYFFFDHTHFALFEDADHKWLRVSPEVADFVVNQSETPVTFISPMTAITFDHVYVADSDILSVVNLLGHHMPTLESLLNARAITTSFHSRIRFYAKFSHGALEAMSRIRNEPYAPLDVFCNSMGSVRVQLKKLHAKAKCRFTYYKNGKAIQIVPVHEFLTDVVVVEG